MAMARVVLIAFLCAQCHAATNVRREHKDEDTMMYVGSGGGVDHYSALVRTAKTADTPQALAVSATGVLSVPADEDEATPDDASGKATDVLSTTTGSEALVVSSTDNLLGSADEDKASTEFVQGELDKYGRRRKTKLDEKNDGPQRSTWRATSSEVCTDVGSMCPSKKDDCHLENVRKDCIKTCDACAACADFRSECRQASNNGGCDGEHKSWFDEQCPFTCGLCQSKVPAPRDVIGDKSTNACPSGSIAETEAKCKAAARSLGMPWRGRVRFPFSPKKWPKGCLEATVFQTGVYFNTDGTGGARNGAKPICKAPAPAPATEDPTEAPTDAPRRRKGYGSRRRGT